jgi:hypothetical protein
MRSGRGTVALSHERAATCRWVGVDSSTRAGERGLTVSTVLADVPAPPPSRAGSVPIVPARQQLAWAGATASLVFAAVAMSWGRIFFSDTYISLTSGRYIHAHGLPSTDHMTVAGAGRPWVDQQWLAHLFMYDLWRVGGDAAVGASSALAFALAFGMLAVLLLRRGAAPVGVLLALGAALVQCILFAETRAQSFAYPLFVGVLWVVLTQSHRSWLRRAALILPLLVLWANVHGSVLLGAAMVVLCCGRSALQSLRKKAWRPAAGELLLSVLAAGCVLATPYGTAMISYYIRVLGDPALATIAEWQPSSFGPLNLPFVIILLGTLGTVCFAGGRGVRLPADMVLLAVVFGVLAAHAVRYQTWFALGVAPLLALAVTRTWSRRGGHTPPPRAIVIAAGALLLTFTVVAGGILARTPSSAYGKWISDSAVHSAARYGAQHPHARILADDVTGSALLWRYPGLSGRVGFDARTEIYKPSQFISFARFVLASGPSWAAVARPYQVIAVTCSLHPALCKALPKLSGWRIITHRDDGMVAVRN